VHGPEGVCEKRIPSHGVSRYVEELEGQYILDAVDTVDVLPPAHDDMGEPLNNA
jgi:hypothetical protein